MEKKLTYSNVIKEMHVIHMSPCGVEYIAEDPYGEEKYDFFPKHFSNWNNYSKEDVKYYKQMYRDANKNLNLWKKGLRRVIKMAKQGPGGMDKMAWGYTGNGPKSLWEYFWKLYYELREDLIEMGENSKSFPVITHYVDGSSTHSMKSY
jgi:hypothetical protein